jgi:hypothetical protein
MVLGTLSHVAPRVKKDDSYASEKPVVLYGLLRGEFTYTADNLVTIYLCVKEKAQIQDNDSENWNEQN